MGGHDSCPHRGGLAAAVRAKCGHEAYPQNEVEKPLQRNNGQRRNRRYVGRSVGPVLDGLKILGGVSLFAEFQKVSHFFNQYVPHLRWGGEEELFPWVGLVHGLRREMFMEFVFQGDCIFREEQGVDVEAERY